MPRRAPQSASFGFSPASAHGFAAPEDCEYVFNLSEEQLLTSMASTRFTAASAPAVLPLSFHQRSMGPFSIASLSIRIGASLR